MQTFDIYEHPTYGKIEVAANPAKPSSGPTLLSMPSPELGQHTEEILLEHDYTWQDIELFKKQGIIA